MKTRTIHHASDPSVVIPYRKLKKSLEILDLRADQPPRDPDQFAGTTPHGREIIRKLAFADRMAMQRYLRDKAAAEGKPEPGQ